MTFCPDLQSKNIVIVDLPVVRNLKSEARAWHVIRRKKSFADQIFLQDAVVKMPLLRLDNEWENALIDDGANKRFFSHFQTIRGKTTVYIGFTVRFMEIIGPQSYALCIISHYSRAFPFPHPTYFTVSVSLFF